MGDPIGKSMMATVVLDSKFMMKVSCFHPYSNAVKMTHEDIVAKMILVFELMILLSYLAGFMKLDTPKKSYAPSSM